MIFCDNVMLLRYMYWFFIIGSYGDGLSNIFIVFGCLSKSIFVLLVMMNCVRFIFKFFCSFKFLSFLGVLMMIFVMYKLGFGFNTCFLKLNAFFIFTSRGSMYLKMLFEFFGFCVFMFFLSMCYISIEFCIISFFVGMIISNCSIFFFT